MINKKKIIEFLDERFYSILLFIISIILCFILIIFKTTNLENIFAIIAAIFLNVSLFLIIIISLLFFQYGIGFDIQEEIFEENNIAGAIFEGFIILSIAIIIARSIL